MRIRPPTALWQKALLVSLVVSASGCVYTRVVHDGWAPLKRMAGSKNPSPGINGNAPGPHGLHAKQNGSSALPNHQPWVILIQTFEGNQRQHAAQALIHQLETQQRMPDLWMHDDGGRTSVYRGRYPGSADPGAISDLQQTRSITLSDGSVLSTAALVSLSDTNNTPEASALDLRQHPGMYSLQIGFYDEAFGSDFRSAAQQAAQALRKQGEEAYFCHGPNRSMVTLGLFTDADFEQQGTIRGYGPEVKALQEKYPYNLGNGLTIIEKVRGQTMGEQPSFLVRMD